MSQHTTTSPRRSKFIRAGEPGGFRVTGRVLTILRELGRARYLTTDQLAATLGGSRDKLQRLLRRMYDLGLVERPAAQRFQLAAHHNRPLVYTLTYAGARLLATHDGLSISSFNWTTKTKQRTSETILHAIEVADDMRAFAKSFRDRGVTFIDHDDLLPHFPAETRTPLQGTSPFSLRVEIPAQFSSGREHVSVLADRLFAGEFPDRSRIHAALEHDRGTEPVFRWRNAKRRVLAFDATSFVRKIAVYHTAWQQRLHTTKWGFKQLRVLTITPTRERIETMLDAVDFVTGGKGSRLFVFTDLDTFRANDPLGPIWINGKREKTSLLD